MKNIIDELQTTLDAYQRMATENCTIEQHDIDGSITTVIDYSHRDYILQLMEIEEFVHSILSSNLPAFRYSRNSKGVNTLERLPLAIDFYSVSNFFALVSPEYEYSSKVRLFFECYYSLSIGNKRLTDPLARAFGTQLQHELYNELIERIRSASKLKWFAALANGQKQKARYRLKSCEKYINNLFDNCSNIQVVRIDFSYSYPEAKDITAEQAKYDLERFLENRRHKPKLFKDNIGYIWKLEWGPRKGYHFHCLFFYKGRKIRNDQHLANLLGSYFKKTTNGLGQFHNCNAEKDKYSRLGIGQIDRKDWAKRHFLLHDVVGYFAKTEQYLHVKKMGNDRCFGKGQPITKSNAGRPRQITIQS